MEPWWNDSSSETEVLGEKNLSQHHFVYHNPKWTGLELNTGLAVTGQ
jgi:hypothetical protein